MPLCHRQETQTPRSLLLLVLSQDWTLHTWSSSLQKQGVSQGLRLTWDRVLVSRERERKDGESHLCIPHTHTVTSHSLGPCLPDTPYLLQQLSPPESSLCSQSNLLGVLLPLYPCTQPSRLLSKLHHVAVLTPPDTHPGPSVQQGEDPSKHTLFPVDPSALRWSFMGSQWSEW